MPHGNDWTPDVSGPLLLRTKAAEILLAVNKERVFMRALRQRVKGAHQLTALRVEEMIQAGLIREKLETLDNGKGRARVLEATAKGRKAAKKLTEALRLAEPRRARRK